MFLEQVVLVGNRLISKIHTITNRRQQIAMYYDSVFSSLADHIDIPLRREGVNHVFHLFND